ncbi:hypothetical protein [Sphingomonas paucimobilis]|uniref:Uncharacterized protein n=1 Tax=Sphingomonas paucimobilis TaxID=13689 RepID=A0A7T3A9T1_SPHPI|nr:hypothetical protein [Sphingomonas paucimobilis]QPT08606.1 hypothetical protein I6G38_18115 [Sphingomonas paucimobilis]
MKRRGISAEEAAVAGVRAFHAGIPLADCPYDDRAVRGYWRLGWLKSQTTKERWDSYPDKVEAALEKARRYLDQRATPGRIPPSRAIAIHFYVMASNDPDAAWSWFCRHMDDARERYAAGYYADAAQPMEKRP